MKKYDQIHETVLKDVLDVYNSISDLADDGLDDLIARHKSTRSIKSISSKSNDLICVFPVLSSRNIAIENQAMVSKAIEKNCVAMLQMIFSAIQISNVDNVYEYIRTFHTNINKSSKAFDIDDVISVSNMIDAMTDSAIQVGGKVDYAIVEAVKRDMKNLNFHLEDAVNSRPLSEFSCNLTPDGSVIVEAKTKKSDIDGLRSHVNDKFADTDSRLNGLGAALDVTNDRFDGEFASVRADVNARMKATDDKVSGMGAAVNYAQNKVDAFGNTVADIGNTVGTFDRRLDRVNRKIKDKKASDFAQDRKNMTDTLSKQVIPGEYKKANELMPTLMIVNFKSRDANGEYATVENAVIGVKAKLYPMSSEDIITHLVAKTKDANWIQKAIRASTREISFFKDFLFAIDKAKIDALSMSRKGSANKMWKVLERRATKSKFNRLMARSNDATAITTIMLSQNEVDFMKKEYQVDIEDVRVSRTLLDKYNLMGICIVDESLEIAKFMYDTGEDMWETIAFSNLERESNDNTYKKVVNLMTKVM